MVIVYVLHNIGVNKSVSDSITEDSHRVNGKFINTVISKKSGSLHHCIHTDLTEGSISEDLSMEHQVWFILLCSRLY